MCQAAHAAHEAGIRYGNPDAISSVVVCSVTDEEELKRAQAMLEYRGIRHYTFVEDDIGDQATALATEPIEGADRRVLRKYPLWNEGRSRPVPHPEGMPGGQGRDDL